MKKFLLIINLLIIANLFYPQQRVIDILPPKGYSIIKYEQGSYAFYIQNLNLKSDKTVLTYQKKDISSSYNVFHVIDMPLLFKSDLEQCADYVMRLWAEYHKENKILNKLYLFDYTGKKKLYYDASYGSFNNYLLKIFNYSNSYSLKAGCKVIDVKVLRPGDMIVQNNNGGIGHVSIILNIASNKNNEKLYLVGYSFMPAQEIHIEKAVDQFGVDGWFTIEGYLKYLSEYLPYGDPVFRRF